MSRSEEMEKKTVRKKWWFKLVIIVLSIGIAGGGGYLLSTFLFQNTDVSTAPPVVDVGGEPVLVDSGEVNSTLEVSGSVVPNQQEVIKMTPGAKVTYMYVNPGDYVYAGNSLFNIKSEGAPSAEGMPESTTTSSDGVTTVKTGISGNITELNVTNGQTMTDANSNAVVVIDSTLYFFKAMVEEVDITSIRGDQRAEVELKAFPGRKFPARITQIDSVGSTAAGNQGKTSYGIKLLFEEVDSGFKPDMTGEGKIYLDSRDSVLRLPLNAIVLTGDGKGEVSVKDEKGNLVPREVSVGLIGDDYVEILEGLVEGEAVYLEVAAPANDGMGVMF